MQRKRWASLQPCWPFKVSPIDDLSFLTLTPLLVVVETVGKIGAVAEPHEVIRRKMGEIENAGERVTWESLDLTDLEKGEEDSGIEGALKQVDKVPLTRRQRLARTAF
jgi:hypothetical protein